MKVSEASSEPERRSEPFIPIVRAQLEADERREVVETLLSGWITTGPRTAEFEGRCRAYLGCEHAVAVSSCTAALHLAVSSLGLGPGDEVIVPPLTFAATVNAILYVGATPVLADVDPATLNLSPEATEASITPRTKAVMVVHYGGAPADMVALRRLAETRALHLLEDAAQAMGASERGIRVGAQSEAACFSFHPAKNITTGEGGLLTTNDEEIARVARLRSWHGIDKNAHKRYAEGGKWYYEVQELGFKYNMTDIQAAIGIHQLQRLDAINEKRRRMARKYDKYLRAIRGIRVAPQRDGAVESRHLYWLVLDAERYNRDRFIDAMTERGIGTSVHYVPIHYHPYYQRRFGWRKGLCPEAERAYEGLVSIPLWQGLTSAQCERVLESVAASARDATR